MPMPTMEQIKSVLKNYYANHDQFKTALNNTIAAVITECITVDGTYDTDRYDKTFIKRIKFAAQEIAFESNKAKEEMIKLSQQGLVFSNHAAMLFYSQHIQKITDELKEIIDLIGLRYLTLTPIPKPLQQTSCNPCIEKAPKQGRFLVVG